MTSSANDVRRLVARAQHLERKSKPQEALSCYRKVVAIDPNNISARCRLAEPHAQRGDTDQALQILNAVNERHPQSIDCQVALGNIHALTADPRTAEQHLRTALELDAGHLPALKAYAAFLLGAKRFGETNAVLQRALEKAPEDTSLIQQLATCHRSW